MTRLLRENGPTLLVPLAWIVAAAAVAGVVDEHALFVAHVVMSVLLVAFVVLSRGEMATGVLAAWKWVIVAGVPVTLAGVAGFVLTAEPLLAVALYGWILLPAVGFVYTGQRVEAGAWIYAVGIGCCLAGAIGIALASTTASVVGALFLVGLGQTAGILDATFRY